MREAQAGIEDLKDFDDPNALARAWRLMSLVYGVLAATRPVETRTRRPSNMLDAPGTG